jgi:tRNA A37 threonylcarbamoyladenosine synthetase subunit TsaC/SUA5/YrdC
MGLTELAVREFRAGRHTGLGIGDVYELRSILRNGGLCVLPSDTCYALAGLPFVRGIGDDIDRLLERNGEKISLAFGSLTLAERYVEVDWADYRIIDEFMPGPLTLVEPMRCGLDGMQRDLMSRVLRTAGTIGVRISDSIVERQLSTELDRPVTSVAIYYQKQVPVKNYVDAVDIVREAMQRHDVRRRLAAVRYRKVRDGEVSTVIERRRTTVANEDPREEPYVVHREGELDPIRLIAAAKRWTFRDVEDWT